MIDPEIIAAYGRSYKQMKIQCHWIIPSCRQGHPSFQYLAEARAYLACLLALYTVQIKRKKALQ